MKYVAYMHSGSAHPHRCSHGGALWALFWRMLLWTPIVAVFGSLAFVAVIALTFVAPALGVILLVNGEFLQASATLTLWIAWLRFGGPARRFVFEGFEHGGL